MNNRYLVYIILVVIITAGLAAGVAVVAFRLGTETGSLPVTGALSGGDITPLAQAPAVPPAIVTNTPTPTGTPTPTLAPPNTPTPTPTVTPTATPSPTPTPTPIVVISRIRPLGRLETTEFAMRTVIDLQNEPSNLWEKFFGTDKLMLMAEGEVVAGFDLAKIEDKDIVVNGTSVKITLPPAEILYSRIDNEKTSVYERETGLFYRPDPTLESRARQLAEQSLLEWAEQRGIYQKAEESGRIYMENFLRSLGFTDVTIEVRPGGV